MLFTYTAVVKLQSCVEGFHILADVDLIGLKISINNEKQPKKYLL